MRIGVDIGGTFTDLVAIRDDGTVFVEKMLSTVDDYSLAIADGIGHILRRAGTPAAAVSEVIHGTTIATNAILEGRGARTGLITTRGFRDILDLRRCRQPDMYSLDWIKPPILVERYLRREVDERIDSHGGIVRTLDVAGADAAIAHMKANGVESVAVCLLNAFVNPVHERVLGEKLRRDLPGVSVSLSSDVMPEAKEYERTSTTCINAYVRPVVSRYLEKLTERLASLGIHAPLLAMQSNGGIMSARAAAEKPIHIVESGPAAGAVGGLNLAVRRGEPKAITLDMGGTTAKTSMIEDGHVGRINHLEVGAGMSSFSRLTTGGGYTLSTPSIDIAEVGIGGGSIAWVDEGKSIRVGPHSAGARPGPVCYDLGGTDPTVTDANLLLGYLNPDYLVGGNLRVNLDRARHAIKTVIADPLGISVEEGAYGVIAVANASMTRVIHSISSERGRDPRDAVLIAFGGGGPVHAAELARSIGMRKVIIPPAPGVFSAFGLLETSIEHGYSKTCLRMLDPSFLDDMNTALAELRQSAEEDLAAAGYGQVEVRWLPQADLQYRGQGSQITVDLPSERLVADAMDALRQAFEAEHERTFGYRAPEEGVEIVNFRLTARVERGGRERTDSVGLQAGHEGDSGHPGVRRAYFGPKFGFIDTPVLARAALRHGEVSGPAIIEQYDTTIVIPPNARAATDDAGNMVIDLAAIAASELVDPRYDPVTRELVRHSLEALADDMALTIVRTCRSHHVKHTGDFSTAIADDKGRLLAQGLTSPLHLGALPDALAAVLATHRGRIYEGDVFVMNDPFGGGMHLPDVFIIKPIFHAGAMVAMAATIVHQVDIGGRVAGGNSPLNTEIFAEGLRLPMLKLFERGDLNEAVMNIVRANVRVPGKVEGDLRAQLAACRHGERDYLALVARYGLENLRRYQDQLLDASERLARDTIRAIPDGSYEFADYLDGDSIDPNPILIHVSLQVKGDEAVVDCRHSSPQVRGAINSTLSVTKSIAYLAFRCLMPPHTSTNSGYMRPITVISEPGSVLSGVMPAAGGARASTAYRLMDAIFGALAKALPDRIMAAGDGGSILHTFFGYDDERRPFVFVDMLRGSWGGRPHADGLDGTALALANASCVPAEIIDMENLVRLECWGYIPDTCGAGKHRGGMGVVRQYRFLATAGTLQYRSERRKFRPYGLDGGDLGTPSVVIWDPAGERRVLPEKGEISLRKDSVVCLCQSGGGGHGDPFTRDAELVWRDVRDELISVDMARLQYGVVIDGATGRLDRQATEETRTARAFSRRNNGTGEVVPVRPADIDFVIQAASRVTLTG